MLVAIARAALSSSAWTNGRLSGVDKQCVQREIPWLLFVPAFQRQPGTDRFEATWIAAGTGLRHVALGNVPQFARHAMRSGPGRAVHPHREAHSRAEVGGQHLLLCEMVFHDVIRQL